jgi:hypothetical protein
LFFRPCITCLIDVRLGTTSRMKHDEGHIGVERGARARQADTVGSRGTTRLWVQMVQMMQMQMGADGRRSQRVPCNAGQVSGPCCFFIRAVSCLARMHMDKDMDVDMDMDMDMDLDMQHPSDNATGRRRRAKWGLDRMANRTPAQQRRRRQCVRADERWAAGQTTQLRHEGAHDCRRVAALVGARRGRGEALQRGSRGGRVSGLSITAARTWGSESCYYYKHKHLHLHLHLHLVPHTPAAWRQ